MGHTCKPGPLELLRDAVDAVSGPAVEQLCDGPQLIRAQEMPNQPRCDGPAGQNSAQDRHAPLGPTKTTNQTKATDSPTAPTRSPLEARRLKWRQ